MKKTAWIGRSIRIAHHNHHISSGEPPDQLAQVFFLYWTLLDNTKKKRRTSAANIRQGSWSMKASLRLQEDAAGITTSVTKLGG